MLSHDALIEYLRHGLRFRESYGDSACNVFPLIKAPKQITLIYPLLRPALSNHPDHVFSMFLRYVRSRAIKHAKALLRVPAFRRRFRHQPVLFIEFILNWSETLAGNGLLKTLLADKFFVDLLNQHGGGGKILKRALEQGQLSVIEVVIRAKPHLTLNPDYAQFSFDSELC